MTEPVAEDDVRRAVFRSRGGVGYAAVASVGGAILDGEYFAALWTDSLTSGSWVTVATGATLFDLLHRIEG